MGTPTPAAGEVPQYANQAVSQIATYTVPWLLPLQLRDSHVNLLLSLKAQAR